MKIKILSFVMLFVLTLVTFFFGLMTGSALTRHSYISFLGRSFSSLFAQMHLAIDNGNVEQVAMVLDLLAASPDTFSEKKLARTAASLNTIQGLLMAGEFDKAQLLKSWTLDSEIDE